MKASEVRKYIERLASLSTIPIVLKQIIEITSDPASPPWELYKVISRDPALAERVIRIANSTFFGHSGRISNIEQAIMFLGYERIRSIAISMSVLMIFSKRDDISMRKFWIHSYEVAFVSALIAEMATMINAWTVFLSGLLHDIGRLIFYNLNRDRYRSIFGTDDLLEKEISIFSCDHATAGGWFAEAAQLPLEHILAIKYHHAPSQATEFKDIVSVVAISEALSRRFSPKIEDDGIWTSEHDALLLELSLSQDTIVSIGNKLESARDEIENFFGNL